MGTAALGFVMLKVRVEVPPGTILVGEKLLVMLGGTPVTTSKVIVRPPTALKSPSFDVPVKTMDELVKEVRPKVPPRSDPEL